MLKRISHSLAMVLLVNLPLAGQSSETAVQFNRDIRPILSEHCFQCHGPDKNQRKADLRLDVNPGAVEPDSGHTAIVPGKPDQSELYRRITTSDEDDRMPPVETGKKLTPTEISLVKQWIEQGANWEQHWAFIPPNRPGIPTVRDARWPRTPIDHFILARLENEGLAPAPEADRRTLIRRLSFDLTGLPPTPEQVRDFTEDTSPDAYDRLIERLLASPHYGERLAVQWLDLVRYADTDGFHADNYRSVWPYRDYVIKALNDNMPFDQFTIEQIAGDLLPNPTLEQKIASTYNRLNRTTEEGGAQAKEYLIKYAADRVRTTSTIWMGATLGCAECHDHKFDPYTTRDFYSFAAFFSDIKEHGVGKPEGILLPNEKQAAELKRLDAALAQATDHLTSTTNALAAVQADWEKQLQTDVAAGKFAWTTLKPFDSRSENGATLELQPDLSLLATGANPDTDSYIVSLATDRSDITALRLEVLTHPNQGLSRGNGNFVLTEFKVEAMSGTNIHWNPVPIASAIADYAQKQYPIAAAIDGKAETGWAVDGDSKPANRRAAFLFAKPLPGGPGTHLRVRLLHQSHHPRHTIGRFRIALTTASDPALPDHGLPADVFEALQQPPEERSDKQKNALAKYYFDASPRYQTALANLNAAKAAKSEWVKTIPTTLATVTTEPRVTRILPRGNWMDDSGEIVHPAVPEFLAGNQSAPKQRLTRLDLAQWLVSKENPLAARAFVNRLWKLHFGTGISRVLDDLGAQGEWPKHPELLDWLAVEFVESGWNVKHMIRLIVSSSVYRQASNSNDLLRERDPFNRLLARQSRFRLEAELIRDNALAISGLLAPGIGGPSVKPYQPDGYWQHLNFPKRTYEHDRDEGAYRRGLYTFWCRTFLHPSLMAFDAPGREECTANRVTSNNPLQALVLLNDPTYVEAARVFAERVIRHADSDPAARIRWSFQQALNREPNSEELRKLTELWRKQSSRYQEDPAAAKQLAEVGEWPAPDDINLVELAAWTSVCRAILNLHETITRL